MINIFLPKVPMDGYTIDFWKLYVRDGYYRISSMKLVYHVNTKWEDYEKCYYGKDIIDSWMIIENGSNMGRKSKWKSVLQYNDKEYNEYFHTPHEAMEEAIRMLTGANDYHNERIAQNDELIQDLRKKLTGV